MPLNLLLLVGLGIAGGAQGGWFHGVEMLQYKLKTSVPSAAGAASVLYFYWLFWVQDNKN